MGEPVLKTKRAENKIRKKSKKERVKQRPRSDVAGLDYMQAEQVQVGNVGLSHDGECYPSENCL